MENPITRRYGIDARYKAYSEEEERRLFAEGHYWTLIANCMPWIRKVCLRYSEDYLDDLVSAVCVNCYEHIDGYDPDKGRFSTWVTWRIKNVASRWLSGQKVIYVPLRPRYPVPGMEEALDVAAEVEDEENRFLCTPQFMTWVHKIVSRLPTRWQQVYKYRSQGLTLGQTGKKIGLSRERVRQIQTAIGKKLCQAYEEKSS